MKRNALLALAFLTAAWSGRADAAFSPAGIFAPQAQSSDGGGSGDGGGTGKVRWRPKISARNASDGAQLSDPCD